MILPHALLSALVDRGVGMLAGVPDSLLKHFCAQVQEGTPSMRHVITANEGAAVAMGIGHHLATGSIPAIYMQNSGLGNAVNPLTSLSDPAVYAVPMVLVVGWRGEPGIPDEPQHVKQGEITPDLLRLLGIPYRVLDSDSNPEELVAELFDEMVLSEGPVCILVRKGTFEFFESASRTEALGKLEREEAIEVLLDLMDPRDMIVSTTGKTSRELFELRAKRGESQSDFLTVGGMGHAASIALGIALADPGRRIVCLDGDGSVLMHMGSLPVIGDLAPPNMLHVLLNNGAHESVGGQPTVARNLDFSVLAPAFGYRNFSRAERLEDVASAWDSVTAESGPGFLELRIQVGSRDDLGRPTRTPKENKRAFMEGFDG